jgi:ABC-type branched-subunit amino acid transport system substrate-binding protein
MTDTQNDTSGSSFFSFLWGNRSRWEKFGVIVFVLVILSTIASLIARAAFLETSRSDDFKIAVVAPMSGPDAGYGNAILKGAEQFAIANKMDAELETVIELEVFDTQGDASAAETLALEAAENDDVVAIIGGWNDQEVQAIAKVAEAHSLPMISVAPLPLGVERLSDASFSLNFSRRDEVRFLANYVRNVLDEKLVSVVVDEARFGAEADLFVETFERFGIEIRHRWSTDAAGGSADKGLQDIASEIKDTPDAGALFLALDQSDAASLTRTLRDLRAINRLVGTSELGTNAFIESLPRKENAK